MRSPVDGMARVMRSDVGVVAAWAEIPKHELAPANAAALSNSRLVIRSIDELTLTSPARDRAYRPKAEYHTS